jgi:hypothetical protein
MRLKPVHLAAILGLLLVVAAVIALAVGINRIESEAKRDAAVAAAWVGGFLGGVVAVCSSILFLGYRMWKLKDQPPTGPPAPRELGCMLVVVFWFFASPLIFRWCPVSIVGFLRSWQTLHAYQSRGK